MNSTTPSTPRLARWLAAGVLAIAGATGHAATPADLLAQWQRDAGQPASVARGRAFFTGPHGAEWRCDSCHGLPPTGAGRHAATGKAITPLAPAANAERFTDAAKADKWFGRNCKDVVGRACNAGEKADVLAWLLTLTP